MRPKQRLGRHFRAQAVPVVSFYTASPKNTRMIGLTASVRLGDDHAEMDGFLPLRRHYSGALMCLTLSAPGSPCSPQAHGRLPRSAQRSSQTVHKGVSSMFAACESVQVTQIQP